MTSNVAKFFAGRSVFITGGSGFVGKQLTEKLLRSCPDIEKVYLLMRAKKGQTVDQRLQQTIKAPVFDVLRERQPEFSKKVVPVVGDVLDDFLGLSDADHSRLSSDVSVFIHSAATLSFVEPLRVAVNMNVLGVRRALNVSKRLPYIESFVHISTAYSQVDKGQQLIEEKIYDLPMSPDQAIALTRLLTDEELASLTPALLKRHNRPNTYTLTKAIAEKLVNEEHEHVPSCIVRPSIIAASQAEPFPGWIDNFAAANGAYAGYGFGTLRTFYTPKMMSKLDIVPVDRVANNVIAAAWLTATNRSSSGSGDVPVYHVVSQRFHVVKATADLMLDNCRRNPHSKLRPPLSSWAAVPSITENWLIYACIQQVYLAFRCKLMDLMLQLTGRKPTLYKLYDKTNKLSDVLLYFTCNEFVWSEKHSKNLRKQLSDFDQQNFNCRLDDLDMKTYYANWWYGLKMYAMKDPGCELRQLSPAITAIEQNGLLNLSDDFAQIDSSKSDTSPTMTSIKTIV